MTNVAVGIELRIMWIPMLTHNHCTINLSTHDERLGHGTGQIPCILSLCFFKQTQPLYMVLNTIVNWECGCRCSQCSLTDATPTVLATACTEVIRHCTQKTKWGQKHATLFSGICHAKCVASICQGASIEECWQYQRCAAVRDHSNSAFMFCNHFVS